MLALRLDLSPQSIVHHGLIVSTTPFIHSFLKPVHNLDIVSDNNANFASLGQVHYPPGHYPVGIKNSPSLRVSWGRGATYIDTI